MGRELGLLAFDTCAYTIDAVSGDLFIAFNGLSRTTFARLDADTLQIKSWYRIGLFTPGPMLVYAGRYMACKSALAGSLVIIDFGNQIGGPIVPDNRKPYFLHNATAGGFAVTVKTAAGAGVTAGASPDNTAVVYCDGTDVLAISAGGAGPYDPAMFIAGTHGSGALMGQIVFPRMVTFPAGFAGSEGYAQVPATASTTLDVQQNGTSIGSITFGSGSSTASFALAADTMLTPGDRLAIVNQNPADTILADLSITLKGSR